MNSAPNLFDVLRSARATRRFKPDPVPQSLLEEVLDLAVCAPSAQNRQPWAFVVLREPAAKRFFADRYLSALERRGTRSRRRPPTFPETRSEALRDLAAHLHEAPVILLVCGRREWPFGIPTVRRVGRAPPSPAATLPCAQNILLACRALGLGATLTTLHEAFEEELCHFFGIPDDYGIAAAVPIGFPADAFGPVRPRPAYEVTHYDRWGHQNPRAGEAPASPGDAAPATDPDDDAPQP